MRLSGNTNTIRVFTQLVKTLSSSGLFHSFDAMSMCAYSFYFYSFSSPLNLNTRYTIFLFTLFNCDFYAAFVLMMAHLPAHSFTCLLARSLVRSLARTSQCVSGEIFHEVVGILNVWCAFICPNGERTSARTRTHMHGIFSQEFLWSLVSKQKRFNGYRKEIRSSQCVQHCLCLRHFNLRKRRARESHYAYHCRPSIHPSNLC